MKTIEIAMAETQDEKKKRALYASMTLFLLTVIKIFEEIQRKLQEKNEKIITM